MPPVRKQNCLSGSSLVKTAPKLIQLHRMLGESLPMQLIVRCHSYFHNCLPSWFENWLDNALCPLGGIQQIVLTVSCTALNQEKGQWRLEKNVVTLSMLADLPHFNFWIALSISDKEISEITGLYKLCTHAIVLYWSYRQWEWYCYSPYCL